MDNHAHAIELLGLNVTLKYRHGSNARHGNNLVNVQKHPKAVARQVMHSISTPARYYAAGQSSG